MSLLDFFFLKKKKSKGMIKAYNNSAFHCTHTWPRSKCKPNERQEA